MSRTGLLSGVRLMLPPALIDPPPSPTSEAIYCHAIARKVRPEASHSRLEEESGLQSAAPRRPRRFRQKDSAAQRFLRRSHRRWRFRGLDGSREPSVLRKASDERGIDTRRSIGVCGSICRFFLMAGISKGTFPEIRKGSISFCRTSPLRRSRSPRSSRSSEPSAGANCGASVDWIRVARSVALATKSSSVPSALTSRFTHSGHRRLLFSQLDKERAQIEILGPQRKLERFAVGNETVGLIRLGEMKRNLGRALEKREFLLADREIGKAQAIVLPEKRKRRLAVFSRRGSKIGHVDKLRGVGSRRARAEILQIAKLPCGELDKSIASMLWRAEIALALPRKPQ